MRTVTAADMLSAVERTLTPAHADRMRAELALAFCTVLWGSTFVVVKNSLDHSSVFVFLAVRFSLAGLCMAIFRPEVLRAFEREQLFAGIRLGFFMLAVTPSRRRGCVIPPHPIPASSPERAWSWCR